MIDLSEVVNDPDMSEPPFQIIRSIGQFAAGGWQVVSTQTISAYGIVSVATPKEINMLPEGDRASEVRSFWSTAPMYVTNGANSQTSDILVWENTKYRILTEPQYDNRGYWKALATRMLGD
jgi:hypothetical protein